MKLIVLLFAIVLGFGATVKKSADDIKDLSSRAETQEYKTYPNILPEVEIVAVRS